MNDSMLPFSNKGKYQKVTTLPTGIKGVTHKIINVMESDAADAKITQFRYETAVNGGVEKEAGMTSLDIYNVVKAEPKSYTEHKRIFCASSGGIVTKHFTDDLPERLTRQVALDNASRAHGEQISTDEQGKKRSTFYFHDRKIPAFLGRALIKTDVFHANKEMFEMEKILRQANLLKPEHL